MILGYYDGNCIEDGNGEWITPDFVLYRREVGEFDSAVA